MRKLQVKDVLIRIKQPLELEDDVLYKRVTIRAKHNGICLRDSQYGKDIGTKKQFFVRKGQFLLSKIDARNGAFGIVTEEIDGAIITGNFWTYEVNEKELNIELFHIMTSLPFFDELCKNSSSGTTNRQYLDEKKFLNQEITLPPIEEQNSFIEHFKKLQEKHSQTLEELQTQSKLINKLRNSILSDAVSGKLVPQDLSDESAEVLLEKIKAEKEKLIKEGKIKKQKPLPPINKDEIPYDLPDGWVWCRLGELLKLQNGYAFKSKNFTDSGIKLARNINIGHGELNWNNVAYYPSKELEQYNSFVLEENDILISLDRPIISSGLKIAIVKDSDLPALLLQRVGRIECKQLAINMQYLYLWFLSSLFINKIDPGRSNGVPHISTKDIEHLLFPLPPLVKQKRIVEKVGKLMATCDALELEVQNSKTETEKLMQSVLKEAFEK